MENQNNYATMIIPIISSILIIIAIVIPITSMGNSTEVAQPGTTMAYISGNYNKEFTEVYEEETPILITDTFYITYSEAYIIMGKNVNVSGDSISINKTGSDITITYMIDETINEYNGVVDWMFVYDPNGEYSATMEPININVNEEKQDNVYVVGLGQFDTYWSYGNGNTNIMRD